MSDEKFAKHRKKNNQKFQDTMDAIIDKYTKKCTENDEVAQLYYMRIDPMFDEFCVPLNLRPSSDLKLRKSGAPLDEFCSCE